MLTIRLTPELELRLNRLAKEAGWTMTALARQATSQPLDDLEADYLADARARKGRKANVLCAQSRSPRELRPECLN
jgi:predicted DNA-binding protein